MVFSHGIGLLILVKLTVLSFYLSFSWELLQQLFLDDCYWIWNILSTTHIQEREVPLLKPRSFSCNLITSFPASVTCSPATDLSPCTGPISIRKDKSYTGFTTQHTKHPRRQIPVKSNNSCGIRQREKERSFYKVQALHRDKPAVNDLPLAWKWKFEELASKFPLPHCRKFCKRKKKVF